MQKKYVKLTSKPEYISQKLFNNDFAAFHMKKKNLTLNKPIYVGFRCLRN